MRYREPNGRFYVRESRSPSCGDSVSVRLPFLWISDGRKDATISVMGAMCTPEGVESGSRSDPKLAALTHSFCLSLGTAAPVRRGQKSPLSWKRTPRTSLIPIGLRSSYARGWPIRPRLP